MIAKLNKENLTINYDKNAPITIKELWVPTRYIIDMDEIGIVEIEIIYEDKKYEIIVAENDEIKVIDAEDE